MRKLVNIILAAGEASRMGAPKQLLSFKGKTLVEKIVELTTALPNSSTIVVTGAYKKEVEQKLINYPINCIYNPSWPEGMGSSISAGVHLAEHENPEGILIILADQVAIQPSHLMNLIQTFYLKNGQFCICSFYNQVKGVPAIFPKHWFELLKKFKGDQGAKKLFNERPEEVYALALDEAAIDIDTPKDWEDFIG